MHNPVYKIRKPLPHDKKRFVCHATAYLIIVGAFGWRVLLRRDGPVLWSSFFGRLPVWRFI